MLYESELSHHGVEGMHWGKRNGPPYPLDASSKAALKEQKEAEEKQKNADVGRERLTKRVKEANDVVDKYAAKAGWENTKRSAVAQKNLKVIKEVSNEIMADPERLDVFGQTTRKMRVSSITGGSISAGAAILSGIAVAGGSVTALPVFTFLAGAAGMGAAKYVYDESKH